MTAKLPPPLIIWRCSACGRRLADIRLVKGSTVTVKCHSCKAVNTKAA